MAVASLNVLVRHTLLAHPNECFQSDKSCWCYYFALQALFKNYPLGVWKTQNSSCCCYLFPGAAVVNHCDPCGVKHKSVFSHGSQDWKSCIKGSQDWAPSEALGWNPPLLLQLLATPDFLGLWDYGCITALFAFIFTFHSLSVSLLCVSFYKDTSHWI